MDTGTDGRFYDSHYDFNHDGFLDCGERFLYEEDVFGKSGGSGGGSYRSSYSSPKREISLGGAILTLFLLVVMITLFIGGFIVAVLCPPVGALMIYCGIAIKENIM